MTVTQSNANSKPLQTGMKIWFGGEIKNKLTTT
jgi:hypothetical protein